MMGGIRKVFCLGAFAAALLAPSAHATLIYKNNFDSPVFVGGGASASFAAGAGGVVSSSAPYVGTYGNFFRSSSNSVFTALTLSGLPTHTGVDIGFLLAFLDSWDSRDGSCCAPDNVDLYIDGIKVADYTYNNALGSIKDIGGGTLIAEYVQFDGNTFYSDTIADLSSDPGLAFAHTGSTLTIGFIASGGGWQGGNDEAWGFDNLQVDLQGVTVPETSTYLLLLAGMAAAAMARRRRS